MADLRPNIMSGLNYRDPRAAIAWLERAFGFEVIMLLEDGEGTVAHCEMRLGDGAIMLGGEWTDDQKSPASVGGINTQSIHVKINGAVDAHCERARAAGAVITVEPATQFYGDRTYRCRDPEGHVWTVAQTVEEVSREDAERVSGLKITGWV